MCVLCVCVCVCHASHGGQVPAWCVCRLYHTRIKLEAAKLPTTLKQERGREEGKELALTHFLSVTEVSLKYFLSVKIGRASCRERV